MVSADPVDSVSSVINLLENYLNQCVRTSHYPNLQQLQRMALDTYWYHTYTIESSGCWGTGADGQSSEPNPVRVCVSDSQASSEECWGVRLPAAVDVAVRASRKGWETLLYDQAGRQEQQSGRGIPKIKADRPDPLNQWPVLEFPSPD